VGDVNGDGVADELDRLIWQDSVANGRSFKPWTSFQHPTLGEVEIGGWHPKFFSQNGPPEVLEEWASKQALFNLFLAQSLPDLKVDGVQVRSVGTEDGTTTWEVSVPVRNDGRIPTALKQAHLSWRRVVASGVQLGIALPALSAALAFYDGLRTAEGPANLLQAQRDYFGSHTFVRRDDPEERAVHHPWVASRP
jgi:hypothetical protein